MFFMPCQKSIRLHLKWIKNTVSLHASPGWLAGWLGQASRKVWPTGLVRLLAWLATLTYWFSGWLTCLEHLPGSLANLADWLAGLAGWLAGWLVGLDRVSSWLANLLLGHQPSLAGLLISWLPGLASWRHD